MSHQAGHSQHAIRYETVAALKRVPVKECGEQMVDLRRLKCARLNLRPSLVLLDHGTYMRQSITKMLVRAAHFLPAGYKILVTSAYRNLKRQEWAYRKYGRILSKHPPEWSRAVLARELNKLVFPPHAGVAPYHTTGGAVDVYIANTAGHRLKHWDTTRLAEADSDHPGLSLKAQTNRDLLKKVMIQAGFSNYPAEFWHWSYGDTGWAFRTGAPKAIYDGVTPELLAGSLLAD